MALTPMHARKALRERDHAEAEARRMLQEAPSSTLTATVAEGSMTRTPIDHSAAAGPHEVKARQVRLQDALGLTTATPIATDPLADKPDAPQTMQPPSEVADLQHQVDGLKLQLTEITVLLTKIITSKTDDVDDAPAPVTDPAPTRSAPTRSAPLAQDRSDLINSTAPAPLLHSEYASRKLLSLVQFARHDSRLFSDDRNRFTPNCIALYKWMRKIDKDMFVEFERKVETQGHTAYVAILDFREAVIAWLDPEVWTMTGLIIVGMTRKRLGATAARIEDLVVLAVRSFRNIEDVIDAVTRTALYDRTKCKSKGFATLPGLAAFEPSADGAADLWMGLLQLILACFRSAGDASKERLTYDQAWKGLKQGKTTVGNFITLSEAVFKLLEDRGGEYSDQQRISIFVQNMTVETKSALIKHVKDLKIRGEYDDAIYGDWGLFSNTMDRIGQSMEVADVKEKFDNYEFESEDDADEVPECQQWAYTGKCDRAPDGGQGSCRYKHFGTAGYKGRNAIMDAAGIEKAKKAAAVGALFGADDTP